MTEQLDEFELREVSASCRQVLDRVGEAVVGKGEALELVLAGILAGGHVLLEDFPGLELAAATRHDQQVLVGASPRGSLALMLTARAYAVIHGRDYVVPEDVKAVAQAALAHRITVRPELWLHEVTGASVVRTVFASVPVPPTAQASQ